MRLLRPYGLIQRGELRLGLEVELADDSTIVQVRPHTGIPDPYVLSTAFVNAHSHLEYRSMLGCISATKYWDWMRAITQLKLTESDDDVKSACFLAASENRACGVALIAEHNDRGHSGAAITTAGLRGIIFQELITLVETDAIEAKIQVVEAKRAQNAVAVGGNVYVSPHAVHTVDDKTLASYPWGDRVSIHVAESLAENEFFESGTGPIADFYRSQGIDQRISGKTAFGHLQSLGLIRKGVQIVHGCELNNSELHEMAQNGVSLAHCPRSNQALGCKVAPIREALDAGVLVGLGMDSAASSGPIDMIDEMRAAMEVGNLHAEEVWNMATTMGAESIGYTDWDIKPGAKPSLIQLFANNCHTTENILLNSDITKIEHVT